MARGTLRLYLGAAPGVGKTYAMLNEGWRRRQRGTDVVIGWVEEHGRPQTDAQIREARQKGVDLDGITEQAASLPKGSVLLSVDDGKSSVVATVE